MSNLLSFNEVKELHMKKLLQYVPIVERVHGGSHPEFHDVRKVFDDLAGKIEKNADKPDLNEEFAKLREITNNYEVPGDTCESYAAVYNMLADMDKTYNG